MMCHPKGSFDGAYQFLCKLWKEESALHDVSGKSRGDRVNEGKAASKGKSVSFSTHKSSMEFINDEIIHPFIVSVSEDGGTKIFAKSLVEEKPSSFSTMSMLWGAVQEGKKILDFER